jgi:hypothetical protein
MAPAKAVDTERLDGFSEKKFQPAGSRDQSIILNSNLEWQSGTIMNGNFANTLMRFLT